VNGALVIVDRMRSIFKLAQGESVAAEMVSQAYEGVPSIEQLFVYGDSGRVCIVGVVVPRRGAVAKILGKDEISNDEFRAACRNADVHDAILAEMQERAKAKKLLGFQQIRDIHLDSTIWSPDNNLLTPTFKIRRKELADRYRNEIEALYERIGTAPK
jgi:long-chain acyl-CoA synthetase